MRLSIMDGVLMSRYRSEVAADESEMRFGRKPERQAALAPGRMGAGHLRSGRARAAPALLLAIGVLVMPQILGSARAATLSAGLLLRSPDVVAVHGASLTLNGQPLLIKGVVIVGRVAPQGAARGPYREAYRQFGRGILLRARQWGANTIRFQFSQPGLDPQGSLFASSYVAEVAQAIKLARSLGFVVIASVQDQAPSGERRPVGMPTAATLRADLTLGKLVKNDRGVIIEVFNEPDLPPNPQNWRLWQAGGTTPQGSRATGMQTIIDTLRRQGVRNLLAIDGLWFSQTFAGMPALRDPLDQFLFAVHPYLAGNGSRRLWQQRFGFLIDEGRPVVATEWSAPTRLGANGEAWCRRVPLDRPAQELAFLARRGIGVVGWAFDFPGTIVTNFSGVPTTLVGKKCGDSSGGPGELLKRHFATAAPRR